jgi:hypothetical protein
VVALGGPVGAPRFAQAAALTRTGTELLELSSRDRVARIELLKLSKVFLNGGVGLRILQATIRAVRAASR